MQLLSDMTGIPLVSRGNQIPKRLDEYFFMMRSDCSVPRVGVSTHCVQ